MPIDKENILPLYYQIKELLLNDVRNGAYRVGEKIPGELALAKEFDVSRPTVRQAINQLVVDKVLWRGRGIGTFVSEPIIESRLNVLTPFVEELQTQGIMPGLSIISNKLIDPSPNVATALNLNEGEKAIEFTRVRLANNSPVLLRTSYFSHTLMPFLLTNKKEEIEPLYPRIESHGFKMASAELALEVVQARKSEASLLRVPEYFPLILWEGVVKNHNGEPLEFVKSLHRSDRYKFHITQIR